jgi:hypothetical protein
MNNIKDFAVFILTHGRAHNVITYHQLRSQGYTGKIYLLVDDEDKQLKDYQSIFKKEVIVFPKQLAIDMTDACDNFNKRNSVVYARNYNFVVAKELGLKYFLQLDDDYTNFAYSFNNQRQYITQQNKILNLDAIIQIMLQFLIDSGATSVAMAQGGDFIGGESSQVAKLHINGQFSRKLMNSFFCSVDRPFKFVGRMNDDVNTYVSNGNRGSLMITVPRIRLDQKQTQTNAGGLTDMYLDYGTYVKSFYTVMFQPSSVKISEMGVSNRRLHHLIKWKYTVPMIISEKHRKRGKS